MLRFPDGRVVVLPRKAKDFRAAMRLLGYHPQLTQQLRGPTFGPNDTARILETYLRWKPAGFATPARWAAPPVEASR